MFDTLMNIVLYTIVAYFAIGVVIAAIMAWTDDKPLFQVLTEEWEDLLIVAGFWLMLIWLNYSLSRDLRNPRSRGR